MTMNRIVDLASTRENPAQRKQRASRRGAVTLQFELA